jgi:hypothetical protein
MPCSRLVGGRIHLASSRQGSGAANRHAQVLSIKEAMHQPGISQARRGGVGDGLGLLAVSCQLVLPDTGL